MRTHYTGSPSLLFNSAVSAPRSRAVLALFGAFVSMLLAGGQVYAQSELAQVLAARVSTTPQRARVVIDLSGTTEFAIVSLDEPERIAIDVKASGVPTLAPQRVAGLGIVASFATSMAEEGRARTELTLNQPATVQQAVMLDPVGGQPARLVVDLVLTSDLDFKARVAADLAGSLSLRLPEGMSGAVSADDPFANTEQAPSSEEASMPPVSPSSAAAPSEPSTALVAQAPLAAGSRPLVVIDPGHGGIDNGASAPSGIHEKDITLAFALQLRDLLVKSGQFDVALTREDDTYLTLNERVTLARQNRADLFVSLHADTFQAADIRGASIYTRDDQTTDILDKVLADGENRVDIVSGYVKPDTKPAVVNILVDLMRRQARQQAFQAATDIVKAMQPTVALRRFPVRQADFFVLQAPDVPSLLIELGFMSNAADIANLEDNSWRDKVVEAISQGVGDYFTQIRGK